MPPGFRNCILVNGVLPPEIIPFSESFTLEMNNLLLNKSTVAQIVTVNGKHEIFECFLSQGFLF